MVKKSENLKKSLKITLEKKNYEEEKIALKKQCYPLSFPILGGSDSTRALQSTPFQNQGG